MKKGDTFAYDFPVTEKVYSGFCGIFNDRNPLHTDKSYARGKGFDDVVMHGNILNGFISFFVGECLPVKNVVLHSQVIRYHNPFYLNETLRLDVEIANVSESVRCVEFNFVFTKKDKTKVARGTFQIGLMP